MVMKRIVTAPVLVKRASKRKSLTRDPEDPAKAKRREKMVEMSARVSETCRLIVFGVLALGYGLFSGDSTFSKSFVSRNGALLKCLVGFAALGVAIDFIQYAAGYRSADMAFRNSSGKYSYKEDKIYWIWNNSYYAKIIIISFIFLIITLLSIRSIFSKDERRQVESQVIYVAFDSGQDRISPLFGPQLTKIADGAKADKLRVVELTGSVDSEEGRRQIPNLAERRAQNIARLFIDEGVPQNKVRIMPPNIEKKGKPLRDISRRTVRLEIDIEDGK